MGVIKRNQLCIRQTIFTADKVIFKDKIRAVREHDRSHGNVTTYVGETGTHFVLIKKYHT